MQHYYISPSPSLHSSLPPQLLVPSRSYHKQVERVVAAVRGESVDRRSVRVRVEERVGGINGEHVYIGVSPVPGPIAV